MPRPDGGRHDGAAEVNGLEQTLLLAATAIVLAGTLVVFVVQYVRRYGKRHDDR